MILNAERLVGVFESIEKNMLFQSSMLESIYNIQVDGLERDRQTRIEEEAARNEEREDRIRQEELRDETITSRVAEVEEKSEKEQDDKKGMSLLDMTKIGSMLFAGAVGVTFLAGFIDGILQEVFGIDIKQVVSDVFDTVKELSDMVRRAYDFLDGWLPELPDRGPDFDATDTMAGETISTAIGAITGLFRRGRPIRGGIRGGLAGYLAGEALDALELITGLDLGEGAETGVEAAAGLAASAAPRAGAGPVGRAFGFASKFAKFGGPLAFAGLGYDFYSIWNRTPEERAADLAAAVERGDTIGLQENFDWGGEDQTTTPEPEPQVEPFNLERLLAEKQALMTEMDRLFVDPETGERLDSLPEQYTDRYLQMSDRLGQINNELRSNVIEDTSDMSRFFGISAPMIGESPRLMTIANRRERALTEGASVTNINYAPQIVNNTPVVNTTNVSAGGGGSSGSVIMAPGPQNRSLFGIGRMT